MEGSNVAYGAQMDNLRDKQENPQTVDWWLGGKERNAKGDVLAGMTVTLGAPNNISGGISQWVLPRQTIVAPPWETGEGGDVLDLWPIQAHE